MPGKKYRSLKGGKSKKRNRLYEKLKRRGHSKKSAARIANSAKIKKGKSKKKSR
jgi:hypothetical protein